MSRTESFLVAKAMNSGPIAEQTLSKVEHYIKHKIRRQFFHVRGSFGQFFPVMKFTIEVLYQYTFYLLVALPVLALTFVSAGLLTGGVGTVVAAVEGAGTYISWLQTATGTRPYVTGCVIALLYSMGIVKYRSTNPRSLGKKGSANATCPYSWENTLSILCLFVVPPLYVFFTLFPSGQALSTLLPFDVFWVLFGVSAAASTVAIKWAYYRYSNPNNRDVMTSGSIFAVVFILAILWIVDTGVASYVFGHSAIELAVWVFVLSSLYLARRIRYVVYEDKWGLGGFEGPSLRLWAFVVRVPLVVALTVWVLQTPVITEPLFVLFLTPLVAFASYIGWRAYVTGGMMCVPYGRPSSPGNEKYDEMRNKINDVVTDLIPLQNHIDDLNAFLSEQEGDFKTISKPRVENCDFTLLEEELQTLHEQQAQQLNDEMYEVYETLSEKVESEMDTVRSAHPNLIE